MKRLLLLIIVVLLVAGTASADLYATFDVEGATRGGASPDYVESADQRVTDYMTDTYGSSLTATGAAAWANSESAPLNLDWPDKDHDDQWLRTYGSDSITHGAFQLSFDSLPIVSAAADFHVFEETSGHDFTVKAYDSSYADGEADRYNPDPAALVSESSWNFGTGSDSFALGFSSPVSLLVFSDGGWYDIAIDNLEVAAVPIPAAVLLGILGLGVAGVKLRRIA